MKTRHFYRSDEWMGAAAALVVLFSAMLDAHVAFALSLSLTVVFVLIRIIQSRKSYG